MSMGFPFIVSVVTHAISCNIVYFHAMSSAMQILGEPIGDDQRRGASLTGAGKDALLWRVETPPHARPT
ncbi:hypothetical protein [Rhizobium sp. G21]|uniref:hypothetical protein n=1 Tax=Rhizobium sp. G21 TaxID=2758439 RepID=UPI0016031833|nr:hypothetical protein [Rhizobium sp. G21]MBB1248594.1 hypothetical protein [Rhizobium sp. G21]